MKSTSSEQKRRVFKAFHSPDRPIDQIAQATRPNQAEEYNSATVLATADRLFPRGIKTARAVMGIFSTRKR